MTLSSDVEIDDNLVNRLSALFRELLEAERQSVAGADDARREELRQLIEWRELVLNDDEEQVRQFDEYVATLPQRPNRIRELRIFGDWRGNLQLELAKWQDELTELEDRAVDKQAIFNSACNKAAYLLRRAAESVELLPDDTGGNGTPSAAHFGQQPAMGTSSSSTLHTPTNGASLPVTLVPSPEADFKDALMRTKQAWIVTTYQDGREDVRLWRANNITMSSNIAGNIRSRPRFRQGSWQKNDIASVRVCIDHPNALHETPPSGSEPKRFYIGSNRDGIFAQCDVYGAKNIVVLEDSTASKHPISAKGFPNWRKLKDRLVSEGVLIDDGQLYKFAIDHELTSPAAVAAMVLSHPQDGRRKLQDAGGIPFDHYYPRD